MTLLDVRVAPVVPPEVVWSRSRGTSVLPVVVWLVLLPAAFWLPRTLDLDPFSWRGAALPVMVFGLALVALMPAVALAGRRTEALAGAGAGLLAAWVALALRSFLQGTPFPFGGLVGDIGRLSAMATRYSEHWGSTDHFVASLPAEYPPLFPWSVGRASALTGIEAWKLVGDAQVLWCSMTVLVAFLLWRRLVPGPLALVICAVMLACYAEPYKPYEMFAAWLIAPWTLLAFASPDRGRLHWLPAGIIGGLLVTVYQGTLMSGCLGLLGLMAIMLFRGGDRLSYLKHLGGVAVVALAVSSWFVLPYLWTMLRDGSQAVQYHWLPDAVADAPFPFLDPSPIGALQVVGLIGAFAMYRTAWWARPLLILLAGTYVYRFAGTLGMVLTGRSFMMQYALLVISPALAAMGILTLAAVAGHFRGRFEPAAAHRMTAAIVVIAVIWGGMTWWNTWAPHPHPVSRPHHAAPDRGWNQAAFAHAEELPGGGHPRYADVSGIPKTDDLPIAEIRQVIGAQARPLTLSHSERLFAFVPLPAYMGNDSGSTNSLVKWKERFDEIQALAEITDPRAFTAASAALKYGSLDLFVLKREGGRLAWARCPAALEETCDRVRFSPSAFDPQAFQIVDLSGSTTVVMRKPLA